MLVGCVCCVVPPSSFALTCLGPPCSSCASMLAVDPSASVNTTRDPDCTHTSRQTKLSSLPPLSTPTCPSPWPMAVLSVGVVPVGLGGC